MKLISLILTLAGFLLNGCAVGQKFDYAASIINVDSLTPAHSAAVAVLDQRVYIRNGDKKESFVGLSRGGYGNPFDVRTASGLPLASEMATAVVAALRTKGIQAEALTVRPTDGSSQARQALIQAGLDRALLFTLTEWKTDTMMRTGLSYDVTLEVFDRTGKRVARKQLFGKEVSGASILSAEKDAQKWFASKVAELFQDDAIAGSLR
ncbi:MAG TPA: hypothetical protein VIE89_33880 [Candidatus Binatia bacterium]